MADESQAAAAQKKFPRVLAGRKPLPTIFGRTIPQEGGAGGAPGGGSQEGFDDGDFQVVPDDAAFDPVAIPEEDWEEAPPLVTGTSTASTDGLQFTHACCRAVRPNPLETTATGVKESRPEPYLVRSGSVKPTHRLGLFLLLEGIIVLAAAILVATDVLIGAMAAAAVAALGLGYLFLSYLGFKGKLGHVRPVVTRHVVDERLERGKIFVVRLDTAGTQTAGLRIQVRDQKAPGLRPVEPPIVKAGLETSFRVRPQATGLVSFSGVDLLVESGDGLWLQEQEWRARTTVEVFPSGPGLMWRSLATGYAPFDPGHPQSLVKLFRDIEYEITREFREGDKMRDVNWKLTNRLDRGDKKPPMMVRKRWTDGETSALMIIDAGASMMEDQAGYRNIDLAVELATELAMAALPRNHEVGMLAFNEDRVLDHIRPTRAKTQKKTLKDHFTALAEHDIPEEREKPIELRVPGDPTNLRLTFGNALKQRSTQTMTMVFLSDLQTTPEEVAQILARQASSGQKVAIMLMPSPKLRGVVPGRSRNEMPELRGKQHVNRMRELLIANGCEFVEIIPSETEFSLSRDKNANAPPEPKRPARDPSLPR